MSVPPKQAHVMERTGMRLGGVTLLALVLSATAASAQGTVPQRRWSIEAAGGVQGDLNGTIVSAALGFAPTRSVTLLIGAERSRTDDEITYYPDGYAATRGGVVELLSAELRYAFFSTRRVSPYVVIGTGRGTTRPNINDLFPHGVDRKIFAIYYGAGARIPVHRRLDAFADWRLIVMGDDASEMAVLGPVRAGVAFRF
jgi:hypothetical protein